MLEVATEFKDTPEPERTPHLIKKETDPSKRASFQAPDIIDESLEFGAARMVSGIAFTFSNEATRPTDRSKPIPVAKHWLRSGARVILSEQVEYSALAPMLVQLRTSEITSPSPRNGDRLWPDPAPDNILNSAMSYGLLPEEAGVIIDYTMLQGLTNNYTFSGTETYYVPDQFVAYGATFVPGAVMKFAKTTATNSPTLDFLTAGGHQRSSQC